MNGPSLIWLVFGFCLALSFVLSGMEAGVFALSRLRIRQQMRAGRRSATALHDYLEHPENFLWTILVGNTVANFLILGWLVMIMHRALSGRPVCTPKLPAPRPSVESPAGKIRLNRGEKATRVSPFPANW